MAAIPPGLALNDALRDYFGFEGLRAGQDEIVEAIMAGRDTLAITLGVEAVGIGVLESDNSPTRFVEHGIEIIDATCPVVAALQRKVKEAHRKMQECGGTVVILGKRGHAEVVGLTGQVDEAAIVVESEEDLEQIDFLRPIYFLSQTTQSVGKFNRLAEIMRKRLPSEDMLTADDTICRRVSSREEHLREFASQHDVVVFVCGRKSSNGKVLYDICRQANERSYNIEEAGELQRGWFEEADSVGICGATSTPKWLMESIAEAILSIDNLSCDNKNGI